MAIRDKLQHPDYLGWQYDWPLFVKKPFKSDGTMFKKNQHYDWKAMPGVLPREVEQLYKSGFVHHNKSLEKQTKVGDRLGEMTSKQLYELASGLNAIVKERTTSKAEFDKKRCKFSKIDDKQRGLIRQFLRNNTWIHEEFYKLRDVQLGE